MHAGLGLVAGDVALSDVFDSPDPTHTHHVTMSTGLLRPPPALAGSYLGRKRATRWLVPLFGRIKRRALLGLRLKGEGEVRAPFGL
jgi:hypothetical protein